MLCGVTAAAVSTFVIASKVVDLKPDTVPPVVMMTPEPVQVISVKSHIPSGTRIEADRHLAVTSLPELGSALPLVASDGQSTDDLIAQLHGSYAQSDLMPGQILDATSLGANAPEVEENSNAFSADAPDVRRAVIVTPDIGVTSTQAGYDHPVDRDGVAFIPLIDAAALYYDGVSHVDLYRLQPVHDSGLVKVIPLVTNRALERVEGMAVERGVSFYIEGLDRHDQTALAITRDQGCLHVSAAGDSSAGFAGNLINTPNGLFVKGGCAPQVSDNAGNPLPPIRFEDYDTQHDKTDGQEAKGPFYINKTNASVASEMRVKVANSADRQAY
ncbi:MAG: hypothetical protein Alpg2KO_24050 [Alphaproteobacteria bacterium]